MTDALDAAEIEQELRSIKPTSYFETELPDLPLTRLRDRTFEVLAHALAEIEIAGQSGRFTKATLLREGADQGRDVLLLKNECVVGVIQCKRYSSTITLPMVLHELMRFALLSIRKLDLVPEADGFFYELWTAGEITSDAQRFFDAPNTWIDTHRTELLEAARKARSGVVALTSNDTNVEIGENEAAIALVRRFTISTVGPTAIKSCLADNDEVRRRFFRGPQDLPRRARASDVDRLMARTPRKQMPSDKASMPYVARLSLDREFKAFMASPTKIFAIVGGSGQGKSTWSDSVRKYPPAATRVDVVHGDDIHPSDQHIGDTIARILRSRPLDGLTSADLVQAILEWFDDSSRLILIDGIDRAPAAAVPTLHKWLGRTFAMIGHGSTRFVVTSRPATWALIAPDLLVDQADVYRPEGAAEKGLPALELGLLSRDEAGEIYRAYGLAYPMAPGRFFRVPGLIARAAAIRSSSAVTLGMRVAVLSESIDVLRRDLQRKAQIGSQQFARLLELFGDALIEAQDGRLDAADLRKRAPESLAALDAAIEADLAISDGHLIRIEPDDLIEYLMALQLDAVRARALLDKHGGDLLIGAAALAAARLEEEGDDKVRAALETLRDGAGFESPAQAAAARALTELGSKTLIREQLDITLRQWSLPNLLLDASPLVQLIDEVDLPPIERLEAAMILAPGEDTWDWRGKYFSDPLAKDNRFITGFGRAAAHAIADDPEGALSFLLKLVEGAEASEAGFDHYESVVSGLLYLAIDGAPSLAATIAWKERSTTRRWLLNRVIDHQPEAVAALLAGVNSPQTDRDAAINYIWAMTYEPPSEKRDDPEFRSAVAAAASAQLPFAVSEYQFVRLLVARLLGTPNHLDEERLAMLWTHVDDDVFWTAMKVRTGDRVKLLAERFLESELTNSQEYLLRVMPAELFAVDEWAGVASVFDAATNCGLGPAAAIALESLMYRASAQREIDRLMPLARKFASNDEADVRRPMIYFAGGPFSNRQPPASVARDELMGLLVEHETGDNLEPLIWKLVQTATEFGASLPRLATLRKRFGSKRVDDKIAECMLTEREGYDILKRQWEELPSRTRPPFNAFKRRKK